MKTIPDKSIDLVLTDPPYGTTACKWDQVIPFDLMWSELKRIRKDNAAVVLFGSEPFSSALRMSNIKEFKYDWIWNKKIPFGMTYAKYQPMRQHEVISVFEKNRYFPQMVKREKPISHGSKHKEYSGQSKSLSASTGSFKGIKSCVHEFKNPMTIIIFDKIRRGSQHPTQKPVALLEYLIKTYTQENETVLDFTMGSGSTGVAAKNLNRSFIGIEKDDKYFQIATERINA